MKLSEKYLQERLQTVMPPGESWSAYEWDALHVKHAKIYGRICFLEGVIAEWNTEFGTDPNVVSNSTCLNNTITSSVPINAVLAMQELEKIKKEENL